MATLYEAADDAVANSQRLQSVLRGGAMLLFPPGGLALVGAYISVLIGWAALAGPTVLRSIVIGDSPLLVVVMTLYVALGLAAALLPVFLVARGYRAGHQTVVFLYRALFVLAVGMLIVSVLGTETTTVTFRGIAVGCVGLAERLSSGANYALAAAFFRARRERALSFDRARDQILNR